jgi:acetyl-CoA carboxylase alpha subunit
MDQISELEKLDSDVLLTQRYEKLRGMGQYAAAV